MSSLLRDAIVDAKALREAALKNAETTVIDKYSEEVRQTLNQLLEQDEAEVPELDLGAPTDPAAEPGAELDLGAPAAPGLDPGAPIEETTPGEEIVEDVPLAATDNFSENEGENLDHLPASGKEVDIEINLDALQETVRQLQDEQEIILSEATLISMFSEGAEASAIQDKLSGYGGTESDPEAEEETTDVDPSQGYGAEEEETSTQNEELDISDEMIDSIVEKLTVDMGASLVGWAGRSSEDMKYQIEKELARRRSTDIEEELEALKKAQEELIFENNQLKESLKQHKQATVELREGLQHVNLSNARLLYTNRVLRNTSLNERQKSKIADAISKAGSVTEAKTIYHTLENATPVATKATPQSLSEAIGRRRTSVIRASRQESTPSDPLAERMKKLAGIK
jgi:hypothetical protein